MRPSETQFSRQGGLFYTSPDEVGAPTPGSVIREAYRTDVDHRESWRVLDDGPWRHHVCADVGPIPDQGWKIHVSAVPDDAQSTLDVVTGEISLQGIPFKHLRDEDRLRAPVGGNCGAYPSARPGGEVQVAHARPHRVGAHHRALSTQNGCDSPRTARTV